MRRALVALAVGILAMASPLSLEARRHHGVDAAAAHMPRIVDASNIDRAFASLEGANLRSEWAAFKKVHGKKYASAEHEDMRFELFKANMAEAARLSKLNPEAKFGITPYSDLHPTEFKRRFLHFEPAVAEKQMLRRSVPLVEAPIAPEALPAAFDWRNPSDGRPVAVTAVKDQGQCGSCWAFSATEAVESSWIMAGNAMAELAPQQTVDCDTGDGGCNGGDTVTAYKYMESAGVQSEKSYPYVSGNSGSGGRCKYNATAVIAKVSGFKYATPGCSDACTNQDEDLLASNLVANGPVSICVDASTWQSYQSGIMTAASGCSSDYNNLDHCVQLVGYGTQGNNKFWSVRNSWNTGWGEQGYIRLKYGENTCGVADEATQPTIA